MSSLTNLMLLMTMLPGARLSEKIGSRKKAVLLSSGGISRFFLLVSVFLPYWFSGQTAVLPVIAARLMVDNFNVLGVPAWTSLAADIVPMQHRGSFFATRNLIMNLSTMVTTLAIGRLITSVGKPGGFQLAIAISFGMGVIATLVYSRIKEQLLKKLPSPKATHQSLYWQPSRAIPIYGIILSFYSCGTEPSAWPAHSLRFTWFGN